MSRFGSVALGEPLEVFALTEAYNEDPSNKKANLGMGVYRTEKGSTWLLPCVQEVEGLMAGDDLIDRSYLPTFGLQAFSKASTELLLGDSCPLLSQGAAFGVQTISGTGSIRIGAELLRTHYKYKYFYLSDPAFPLYSKIFKCAGFKHERAYRYWHRGTKSLDLEGMLEDLENAEDGSVVMICLCGHNPTGCDPNHQQWRSIQKVIAKNKLFPFFDAAYLGLASGDLDEDAWAVRYFASKGTEFFCAQSFDSNFGLYNETVGNLTIVTKPDGTYVQKIKNKLTLIIRGLYSNPSGYGARIVAHIFNAYDLNLRWKECVKDMTDRIREMRENLRCSLERLNTPGTWNHITSQTGLFSYTGLTEQQVEHLIFHHHIYMLRSGRINICGLNAENMQFVAKAILESILLFPEHDSPNDNRQT